MAFAGYPAPFILDGPDGKKVEHLIWGDYVEVLEGRDGDWVEVRSRGENGWLLSSQLQEERLLEVNFVDVGQGDGCFIVTPEDERILVDAGEGDNLVRFLSWRFNLRRNPGRVLDFRLAVITHPDSDHYKGFEPLLESSQFSFQQLFHNGIVERRGQGLGPKEKVDGRTYLAEVIPDQTALDRIIGNPDLVGQSWYPNLLKTAAESGRVGEIRSLSADDRFVPGFGEDGPLSIQVLGPVTEEFEGRRLLRTFAGDDGMTKNGHSVLLLLRLGRVRILLGGDLNRPAEEFLLEQATGLDPRPSAEEDRERLVTAARETFGADVAKACHHGSADFTDIFVDGVHALATVVSSGDAEPFAHPRPDTLGALGKWGRGDRPLILSTELARSVEENIKAPQALRDEIQSLYRQRAEAEDELQVQTIDRKIHEALDRIERSIAVYGLINLRTDGERVLLAQKLETPAADGRKWDVHRLEPGEDGRLQVASGD